VRGGGSERLGALEGKLGRGCPVWGNLITVGDGWGTWGYGDRGDLNVIIEKVRCLCGGIVSGVPLVEPGGGGGFRQRFGWRVEFLEIYEKGADRKGGGGVVSVPSDAKGGWRVVGRAGGVLWGRFGEKKGGGEVTTDSVCLECWWRSTWRVRSNGLHQRENGGEKGVAGVKPGVLCLP